MSDRQPFFVTATLGAACLVLASCGGGSDTTPAPTPAADECNLAGSVFLVAGNTAQMKNNVYDDDGTSIAMTQVSDFVINGGASLKGSGGLIEIAQTTKGISGIDSGTTARINFYVNYSASEEKIFGFTNANTAKGMPVSTTYSFSPTPSWPINPTQGTPYTNTYTQTTEIMGAPSSQTVFEVRTYSTEQITTLAGTFAACKVRYDSTRNGATITSYSWKVGSGRLKGHLLKSVTAAGVRTVEATSLTVNGS
ncbi:MAG: hypothetical protein IPN53_17865 [Comamonadaceae bacterium]|nr:hypothetical protein [Comamonadaceae bacterium]